jgi:nitroreductase
MEVFDAIKKRRSVRSYLDKPVEREKLLKILQAARLAPSARNRQEWRFVVITDKKTREELVSICEGQRFIAEAPIVIVAVADPSCRWYKVDTAIAVEHMVLEAVELGLGTCWIGAFDKERVGKLVDIPRDLEVVVLLTIGYPKKKGIRTHRKPLDEIVFYERYKKSMKLGSMPP